MTRDPRQLLAQAIEHETLPSWVARVVVRDLVDAEGEPALAVLVVIRDGAAAVVSDSAELARVRDAVHRASKRAQVDQWPYTRFVSADEVEAA